MKLLIACFAVLIATAGQARAAVIITYQDFGSDLQFDYSGSLNIATPSPNTFTYATVSVQSSGSDPVFYNSPIGFGYVGSDYSVTHTPGPFATNLPVFTNVLGTGSGTSFMFRLNDGIPGPASRVDLWGDWGAANTPINGQLILTGQSAAGIGMVNGWNLQTDWGSITFQAAQAAVPEPTSLAIFGIGALGMIVRHRRKQKRKT